jgi:hypothetical protein
MTAAAMPADVGRLRLARIRGRMRAARIVLVALVVVVMAVMAASSARKGEGRYNVVARGSAAVTVTTAMRMLMMRPR